MKKNKTIGSILVLILIFISHVQCTSEPTEASIQTLTTDSIVFISPTTVIVGGLLPKSYRSVLERGIYYGTSPNPAQTGIKRVINSSNQVFSDTLTGLQPNAKYYVQAYAINSAGIGYGAQIEFITREAIQTLTTDSVTFIIPTTVIVGGLFPKAYRSVLERGIYYGTSPNPAQTGIKRAINSNNQAFSDTLTGLQPNIKYYVQAYAINSAGIGYGTQVEFITREAIVSFSFDDGDMEQTNILDSMGVRGTVGFVTTWKWNRDLVKMHLIENEGWEIASHSVNHLKAPESEYIDSRDYLVAQGFKIDGFIYPGGGANEQQVNWASKHYSWARDVVTYKPGYSYYRDLYNRPPFNRYKLRGAQTYTHSLEEFKKIVDSVDKDKGWLIWMIHVNQITNADLVNLIKYIKSKDIEIMPIRDALNVYDTMLNF